MIRRADAAAAAAAGEVEVDMFRGLDQKNSDLSVRVGMYELQVDLEGGFSITWWKLHRFVSISTRVVIYDLYL
jgi:hypothetical protein